MPWQAVPNQFTLRSGKLRRSLATVAAAQWATLTASCPWPPSAASCLVPPAWQPPPAACCLAALFAVSANKLAKCQLCLLFSRKREIQNRRKTKPKRVAPLRVAEQPNKHKKKEEKKNNAFNNITAQGAERDSKRVRQREGERSEIKKVPNSK